MTQAFSLIAFTDNKRKRTSDYFTVLQLYLTHDTIYSNIQVNPPLLYSVVLQAKCCILLLYLIENSTKFIRTPEFKIM